MPGTSTRVTTSVSVTSTTRTATLPSSISRRSPGAQSPGRPLKVVPTSSLVPGTSRVVMVKVSPIFSSWGPSWKVSRRILGPWRSTSTAIARPDVADAFRTRAMTASCSSAFPCDRLIRATSMPASTSAWSCSGDSVAGPIVQTILARRIGMSLPSNHS